MECGTLPNVCIRFNEATFAPSCKLIYGMKVFLLDQKKTKRNPIGFFTFYSIENNNTM